MDLLRCERILDKLKLVNYEKRFLPKYRNAGIRALGRHYSKQKNDIIKTSEFSIHCIVTSYCCFILPWNELNRVPVSFIRLRALRRGYRKFL